MKINKFILVGIFLLAIISLAPLCASEDIAGDELALDDTAEVSQIVQDDVIGDGEEDSGLKVDYPSDIATGDEGNITITGAKDITGNLYWEFEGENSSISLLMENKTLYSKIWLKGTIHFCSS